MKSALVMIATMSLYGLSACGGGSPSEAGQQQSPGIKSTVNLPPSPNNAGTDSSSMNTPLATVGGELPDSSNPIPDGAPGAGTTFH